MNLQLLRRNLGMTQQQFADAYGLSVASVRNWEQGSRQPEAGTIHYLYLIEQMPVVVKALIARQDGNEWKQL